MWDNGADQLDRSTGIWNDDVAVNILISAVAGENSTLADSTTDPSLSSQFSSAYAFHEQGTAVSAQNITYLLNGNSLIYIKNSAGYILTPAQYTFFSTSGTLTLTSSYFLTLYNTTSPTGVVEILTLTFSSGAALTLTIVQYGLPSFATTTYDASSSDLNIPITWPDSLKSPP
jgi:endoglucanase